MAQKIDWDKPIEALRGSKWEPAKVVYTGNRARLIVVDPGGAEGTRWVCDISEGIRNTKTKHEGWVVVATHSPSGIRRVMGMIFGSKEAAEKLASPDGKPSNQVCGVARIEWEE